MQTHELITSAGQEAFSGLAWAIANVVAVLLGLLLLQIIAMRAILEYRRRRDLRFRTLWEPILASCIDTFPARLPALLRSEVPAFLLLWNYFQESVRDNAKDRLNRVAHRLHVCDAAVRMMQGRDIRHRLIALTTLGHLRDPRCWDEIVAITGTTETVLSLCAAKALMRIDPNRAAAIVVQLITVRVDWSAAAVAAVLLEGGPDAISRPLAQAAEAADASRAPLLIRLLELAHRSDAGPAIRSILETHDETEVVTACLRGAQDPALLDEIRGRLSDGRWQVRVHAAQALGRLGSHADEPLLIEALADPEWWVRYRAAQAISALPTSDMKRLRELSLSVGDRYGRDILRQIMAERELAC